MKCVYVISGPPGSGKSTYVQGRATSKDLVIDLDNIAQAIRGGQLYDDNAAILEELLKVRQCLYDGVSARNGKWENAYVITAGKNAAEVAGALHGELIEMKTPKEECRARIRTDDRRKNKDLFLSLIDDWFGDRKDNLTAGPNAGNTQKREEYSMAEETVNQEVQTAQATPAPAGHPLLKEGDSGAAPEKTFTQAQVDAIVGDRLAREREKYKDYDALKQSAERHKDYDALLRERDSLKAQAAVRDARDKVAGETGVPVNLLTGDTEETCRAQAEALLKWHGEKPLYPDGNDGGEVLPTSKGSTREQFAEWFNSDSK